MESMVNFYPCQNIQETSQFYLEIIGLKLYNDQGNCQIFDTGYGYLGFVEYEHHQLASHVCISFNLKDEKEVDLVYQRLKQYSYLDMTVPQKHLNFNVYSFFIKDPNGYNVEFQKIL